MEHVAGRGGAARARAAGALRRDGARLLLRLPGGPPRPGDGAPRRRPRPHRADRGRGVVHDAGLRPRQPRPDARRHGPLPGLPRRGAGGPRGLGVAGDGERAGPAGAVVAAAVLQRPGRLGRRHGARARGPPRDGRRGGHERGLPPRRPARARGGGPRRGRGGGGPGRGGPRRRARVRRLVRDPDGAGGDEPSRPRRPARPSWRGEVAEEAVALASRATASTGTAPAGRCCRRAPTPACRSGTSA